MNKNKAFSPSLFEPTAGDYRVGCTGQFNLATAATSPPDGTPGKSKLKHQLKKVSKELDELQRLFYAAGNRGLLLVFQAMDAAGKDSTIRAVMKGIDPAGCHVHSFKQPAQEELDHDFLWRTNAHLPRRGHISIFNRSYYEEVLVVRVHPDWLGAQQLPLSPPELWAERYAAIAAHERHLAASGTVIMKFWLNVSRDEQRNRFLDRLEQPDKRWKFSEGDVRERGHWDSYMRAYEDAINATSKPWAPWYAIPADNKKFMRLTVAQLVRDTLRSLDQQYPQPDPQVAQDYAKMQQQLIAD